MESISTFISELELVASPAETESTLKLDWSLFDEDVAKFRETLVDDDGVVVDVVGVVSILGVVVVVKWLPLRGCSVVVCGAVVVSIGGGAVFTVIVRIVGGFVAGRVGVVVGRPMMTRVVSMFVEEPS